jgi:putative ABC transport system substrate-binding protein
MAQNVSFRGAWPCPELGVKPTCRLNARISQFDPKRTYRTVRQPLEEPLRGSLKGANLVFASALKTGEHMRRRDFLRVATATTATAFGVASFAQQSRMNMHKIGVLLFNSPRTDPIGPFLEGLNALGYTEGKNIAIDYAFAEGRAERLPELAVALVDRKPDVIFAYGGDVAPHAKRATGTIPVVVMVSNDPVQSGLVKSIREPGGNVTGLTLIYDDLAGKMLALLKEAAPKMSRAAVLWNPIHADPEFRETKRIAGLENVEILSLEVRRAEDFDGAFKAAIDQHADGLIFVSSRLLLTQREKILAFAANSRIPTIGSWGDWARDGLLLSYGPNTVDIMRRVAFYVDKILKGARPADIPIERPARFELVVNQKIAKDIRLAIPPTLLARADEVIE